MLFRLPSIEAWPVVFFHDPSQEKLVYIGETVTHPKKPSNTGFSPGRLCRGTQTRKIRIKKARLKSQSGSVSTEETPPEATVSNPPFLFTPSINFISESHAVPTRVFSPKQPPATGKEPLSTLTVSEGQQLRDTLLQSIFKCMQIQNSLYRLVFVKLQAHVKAGQTDSQRSYVSDSLKATSAVEAAEIINDGPSNHHAEDTTESRLDGVPKVPAMESAEGSLDDIPEASSVRRTGESLKYVPDASSLDGAGLNLNETPKDLSRQSSGETPIDATEATSGDSTGKCQNDVAKVTGTATTEENLREFPKASIEECTAKLPKGSGNIGTPSMGGPEVNLDDAPEAFSSKVDGPSDVTSTLLCELKNPLETLVRCNDIQRTLFQRLISLNLISAPEVATDPSELQSEEEVDMLAVQSKLDEITFKCKTRMECNYARNPFSNQPLEPSTNIDVLHFRSASVEIVPHGRGTLETSTGDFIYSGDFCRGKRHGKGEGLIFSRFAPRHGFYTGGWKHNMRHGHGKMMFSSGAVYEGQWQFDKMTGYGTLKLPDGTIQEGTWKDGSLHGCSLFTWPHGVAEYREYDASRGQLSSCAIEREATEKLSRLSSIQSQLLNLQGCVTELRDEKRFIAEQLNTLNAEHADLFPKIQDFALEIRRNYEEQWERVTQKHREELDNAGKAAEEAQSKSAEEIAKLKKELEESKGALMCQICFTRPRDCIILPCSHLLYCRVCVHEHKSKGDSRCPTCRGTINSEILCNVNHSS